MNTKWISEKSFVLTAAIGSVLIVAILIGSTIWASRRTVSSTNEAVSAVSSFYLEAMADHDAQTITNLIDSNFDHMEKAIRVIDNEGIGTQEELRASLGRIKSLLSLSRFALIDEDDIVYTQYTTYTGRTRHDFLTDDKMDDRVISTVYLYGSAKQLCLAIPTPDLMIMGKKFKACFVQIDIKDIIELLAIDDEDRTSFGLYSMNGGNLSDTVLGPVISDHNILEATKNLVPGDKWDKMCNDFAVEKEGGLSFVSGGLAETLCYVPVSGTGWEMVVLIRESVIHDQIIGISENNMAISRNMIIFVLVAMLLFASVLLLELRNISRSKLEEEQEKSNSFKSMANTDSLTGIRNKHAFSDAEEVLNHKIKEKEIDKLAIVVCDINGLKYVNDTQGHAAGDKLIIAACKVICEFFTHGAVYRIGGDEFAVILQGRGYDEIDGVIRDMNRQMEENIKTGDVVVSLGYSTMKDNDEELHDMFERADQMMYERKKELKAMGAKTRE